MIDENVNQYSNSETFRVSQTNLWGKVDFWMIVITWSGSRGFVNCKFLNDIEISKVLKLVCTPRLTNKLFTRKRALRCKINKIPKSTGNINFRKIKSRFFCFHPATSAIPWIGKMNYENLWISNWSTYVWEGSGDSWSSLQQLDLAPGWHEFEGSQAESYISTSSPILSCSNNIETVTETDLHKRWDCVTFIFRVRASPSWACFYATVAD